MAKGWRSPPPLDRPPHPHCLPSGLRPLRNFTPIACSPGFGAISHCPPSVTLHTNLVSLGLLSGFLLGAVFGLAWLCAWRRGFLTGCARLDILGGAYHEHSTLQKRSPQKKKHICSCHSNIQDSSFPCSSAREARNVLRRQVCSYRTARTLSYTTTFSTSRLTALSRALSVTITHSPAVATCAYDHSGPLYVPLVISHQLQCFCLCCRPFHLRQLLYLRCPSIDRLVVSMFPKRVFGWTVIFLFFAAGGGGRGGRGFLVI